MPHNYKIYKIYFILVHSQYVFMTFCWSISLQKIYYFPSKMINQQRASHCHTSLFPLKCRIWFLPSECSTLEMTETTWAITSGSLTFDRTQKRRRDGIAILQKKLLLFFGQEAKKMDVFLATSIQALFNKNCI